MINSGRMRERVTIQRPTDRQNPFGEATLEWETLGEVWAQVTNISARDYFAAQQAGTLTTHRVLIRFYAGMDAAWRLVWRGRIMEVVSVLEREDRRVHEILARETSL